MRNFDVERQKRLEQDRGFQIGGETFIRRASVRPESIAAWENVATGVMDSAQVLTAIDETIINLIEPGVKNEAHRRWMALRARDNDAVNLGDLIDVITWLVEEQAQRPTEPSSNSSVGDDTTGTPSTDASSPPVLQEVPAP